MSAFRPPRCCASGSLGNNIINRWFLTKLQLSVFGPKVEAWVIDLPWVINRWILTKLQLSVFGPKVEAWVIDFTDG